MLPIVRISASEQRHEPRVLTTDRDITALRKGLYGVVVVQNDNELGNIWYVGIRRDSIDVTV